MTNRHMKFGAIDTADKTPVSFELEGRTFNCRTAVPGAVLVDFVRVADGDDGSKAGSALVDFIINSVVPDEREEFTAVLHDPDTVISLGTLGELAQWLVQTYSGQRPTTPSSS